MLSRGFTSTVAASTRSAAAWAGRKHCSCSARFPQFLAGAAAFDAPTNMAARYRAFQFLPFGVRPCRGSPGERSAGRRDDPRGYALRSPLDWARRIAFAGVPLQIWWSTRDRTVSDQRTSRACSTACQTSQPRRTGQPVRRDLGAHDGNEAHGYLPYALSRFGLLPPRQGRRDRFRTELELERP